MRCTRSAGHSLVEAALVLGAFMGMVLGMTGIGQSLFLRQTLAARAHDAARWGAVNSYDPGAIRNLVLYGAASPQKAARPLLGLSAEAVTVGNPGCPGPSCRITVSIPAQGIQSMEPVEGESQVGNVGNPRHENL